MSEDHLSRKVLNHIKGIGPERSRTKAQISGLRHIIGLQLWLLTLKSNLGYLSTLLQKYKIELLIDQYQMDYLLLLLFRKKKKKFLLFFFFFFKSNFNPYILGAFVLVLIFLNVLFWSFLSSHLQNLIKWLLEC